MGFWQSREDPSGVSGGWKEGSAWDEQGKRRKHGILAAFGEKGGGEKLRNHCIIDLRRKPPRLGKAVRKPWKQWDSGTWKMGWSRGAGKKSEEMGNCHEEKRWKWEKWTCPRSLGFWGHSQWDLCPQWGHSPKTLPAQLVLGLETAGKTWKNRE